VDLDVVLTESCAAMAVMRDRVDALVGSIPDMTVPIRGSEWRVREAAVHMLTETEVHTDLAVGKPTPRTGLSREEIARDNERFLAAVPEAPPAELGGLIRGAVDRFLAALTDLDAGGQVVWAGDAVISVAELAGVELGELLLHGYDIASVVGIPWPIEPGHAELVLFGYQPLYRTIVNHDLARGLTANLRVELRGGSAMTLRFADGAFSVEPAGGGPVDCTISAEPVALLMVVSRRLPQWAAIALGLLQASGPRADLALRLTDLFLYP
jgi:mycothiol maleylpyruvate isomerase-like protein/SCP-2 sterol transfer family protein